MTEESYNRTNINIVKRFPSFILGKCKCGCDGDLDSLITKSRPYILRTFIKFHHTKIKTSKLDYRRVYIPSHPYADSKGCVKYHRLVMEEILGRYLEPWEVVDHINRDRLDNRPENLRLFDSNSAHMKNHKPLIYTSDRQCRECKSFETSMVNRTNGIWRPAWYGNKEKGFICVSCYHKIHYEKKKKSKNQSLLCYIDDN
jgi:hypothetical protein